MSQSSSDRPYVQAWLRRVERQLRGSGRISQIAFSLAKKQGGDPDDWRLRLRNILSGQEQPSADLIADIDKLLAKPIDGKADAGESQGRLL